jgi:DNA polymerase-4
MAAKILSDMSKPDGLLSVTPENLLDFLTPLPVERLWGVGRVTLARMHECGIKTVGDLARRDPSELKSMFGSMGSHLHELASGNDSRPVVADWQRKSYGEENTFAQDVALDSLDLQRVLIAHGDAIARRLRADGVRARTVTLKLKLARPLGGGRYPLITRSYSLDGTTDDGPEISRVASQLLSKVGHREKIRLAGVQVHQLERADTSQFALFEPAPADDRKRDRLNRALDSVAKKFGDEAVTRGLAKAERAAPTRRIK